MGRTDDAIANELEDIMRADYWRIRSVSSLAKSVGSTTIRIRKILNGDRRFRSFIGERDRIERWRLWN